MKTKPRTGIRYQPPAQPNPRPGKPGGRPAESDGPGYCDELRIELYWQGYKEPSVFHWTRGSMRFRDSREAAVEKLRRLADDLEGQYETCDRCHGRGRVRVDGKEEK